MLALGKRGGVYVKVTAGIATLPMTPGENDLLLPGLDIPVVLDVARAV